MPDDGIDPTYLAGASFEVIDWGTFSRYEKADVDALRRFMTNGDLSWGVVRNPVVEKLKALKEGYAGGGVSTQLGNRATGSPPTVIWLGGVRGSGKSTALMQVIALFIERYPNSAQVVIHRGGERFNHESILASIPEKSARKFLIAIDDCSDNLNDLMNLVADCHAKRQDCIVDFVFSCCDTDWARAGQKSETWRAMCSLHKIEFRYLAESDAMNIAGTLIEAQLVSVKKNDLAAKLSRLARNDAEDLSQRSMSGRLPVEPGDSSEGPLLGALLGIRETRSNAEKLLMKFIRKLNAEDATNSTIYEQTLKWIAVVHSQNLTCLSTDILSQAMTDKGWGGSASRQPADLLKQLEHEIVTARRSNVYKTRHRAIADVIARDRTDLLCDLLVAAATLYRSRGMVDTDDVWRSWCGSVIDEIVRGVDTAKAREALKKTVQLVPGCWQAHAALAQLALNENSRLDFNSLPEAFLCPPNSAVQLQKIAELCHKSTRFDPRFHALAIYFSIRSLADQSSICLQTGHHATILENHEKTEILKRLRDLLIEQRDTIIPDWPVPERKFVEFESIIRSWQANLEANLNVGMLKDITQVFRRLATLSLGKADTIIINKMAQYCTSPIDWKFTVFMGCNSKKTR